MSDKNKKIIFAICGVIAALLVAFVVMIAGYAIKFVKIKNEVSGKKTESGDNKSSDNDDVSELTEEVELDTVAASIRPSFLSNTVSLQKTDYVVDTKEYTVKPDLSDVYNIDLYYFTDEEKKMLSDNLFMVSKPYGDYEFFEQYERNRYDFQSSFVTVDSLMHTYHLYFSHLLKTLEKNELSVEVKEMSKKLLADSNRQYEELVGTEWEEAAKRNVAYFAIACSLLSESYNTSVDVSSIVDSEVSKIVNANGIDTCLLTDSDEDYTQYKPRGYYDGDENLEKYFRTMMWFGRIQFNTKDDDMMRSALLMNIALNQSGLSEWKNVYDVTSFFVGINDDLGYYEYYPVVKEVYGDNATMSDIIGDDKAFELYVNKAKALKLPEINSTPIQMGDDNVIQGYRFMGQRFTIDAAVMQNLIYSRTDANSRGDLRMLPDVLDVAAALGSNTAYELLEEHGDMDYKNYRENMDKMVSVLASDKGREALSTSLYGNWLNALSPLLKEKGSGYPSFMQSKEWAKKDIETFAGSYTELKHDTVLYAKQVMAEMGGGEVPEYDDRGYVQPEPDVYARFTFLADATRIGLEQRNMISDADADSLKKLSELADSFRTMSEKELRDETLTDQEYDLIREYGGNLEHFWYEVTKADTGDSEINTEKYQAALCVDVATDPNGSVLEMATGKPCDMFVIVNVDGKIKLARGVVYSFYQFEWPMSDRLTDTKWRQMMGFEPLMDGYYDYDDSQMVDIPWWTENYSHVNKW